MGQMAAGHFSFLLGPMSGPIAFSSFGPKLAQLKSLAWAESGPFNSWAESGPFNSWAEINPPKTKLI